MNERHAHMQQLPLAHDFLGFPFNTKSKCILDSIKHVQEEEGTQGTQCDAIHMSSKKF